MKKILFYAVACLTSVMAASCDDRLVIDHVNEADYANVTELLAGVSDISGRSSKVVDLKKKEWTSAVKVDLGRAPKKGVDMQVSYDPAYLSAYNKEHGTSFDLFPEDHFTLADGGAIVVAPDEKTSYSLDLTLLPLGTENYENDKTYVLPFKVTTTTDGVRIPEEAGHCVYLVKNLAGQATADKSERYGEDYVKTVVLYDLQDTNPLNSIVPKLETGEYFMDYIGLWAANIRFEPKTGELLLLKNSDLRIYLDNYDHFLKPVRDRGIKVLLGLLGSSGPAGLAQLSDEGCKIFARKLADFCYAYHFDGVMFDDEYSGGPDLDNPLFAEHSAERGSKLMFETKKAMPDKIVSTYQYGLCRGTDSVDGIDISEWMDFIVADYSATVRLYGNMTKREASGFSFQLNNVNGGYNNAVRARTDGYGYVMCWAPWAYKWKGPNDDHFHTLNQLDAISRGLYGVGLQIPTDFYPQSPDVNVATTPVKF